MRYMMLIQPDLENSPADGMPSQAVMDEMGKLLEEMTKSGVLLDTAGLKPNEEAVRVTTDHGKLSVVDGPFTESKEMVGGYLVVQVKSKDEALEWANRFVKSHGEEWTLTVELREIMEDV